MPRFLWAEKALATSVGDYIRIYGATLHRTDAKGLLSRYAKPLGDHQSGTGDPEDMPLLSFANADDRDQLLRFVQEFGPVVVAEKPPSPASATAAEGEATFVEAIQSWKELECERNLLRSLLRLLQIARSEKEEELRASFSLFDEVLRGTSEWIAQHKRESSFREEDGRSSVSWIWSQEQQNRLSRLFHAARAVLTTDSPHSELARLLTHGSPVANVNEAICEVLNAFPTFLQFLVMRSKGEPAVVEMPRSDLDFGIRPVLYFMLRYEYLRGWELRLCSRVGCGVWFRPFGRRLDYHDAACARKERQKRSWETKGRETRKARNQARAAKAPTKKKTKRTKRGA